ncbi:hypothetical protein [Nocardioides sp.]|uniref:hypothetical protein n=1 Tax=Nocardioides sp. TaxID=35761 RepID=UPI00262E52BE|nr:hypothetical protein [Nocardioides sp.]MCW2738968.1 glycosyl hydrolase [Nocardioides sp.]
MTAQQDWLARMTEEHDRVALGLVLDAYATEYHHPGSDLMREVVADLAARRGAGQRRFLARSMLLAGFRYGAVHLEERDPDPGSVLALASGRHLSPVVQQRVLDPVQAGGGLLYLGPLPERDLDGTPCTLLADGLGLHPGDLLHDGPPAVPVGRAARLGRARPGGSGRLAAATRAGRRDRRRRGAHRRRRSGVRGVGGERPRPGRGARRGHVLPLGIDVAGHRIVWASAEVTGHSADHLDLASGLDPDGGTTVLLAPGTAVSPHASYVVEAGPEGTVHVTGGRGPLSIRFGQPD